MMSETSLDNDLSNLSIDKSRRRQPGGRAGRYLTLLVLAALFGGGGYVAYTKLGTSPVVQVVQPTRETTGGAVAGENVVLTAAGYIVARDVYDISTKIVGRVKEIFIERGDIVQVGDTIITIEDEEYVAQLGLADARVANAQARLDQLRAGSRPEEIARAQAEAASADATAVQARKDEARIASLREQGIASPQELDLAKASRRVADQNLLALREVFRLAELGPRVEEIRMAEAQLQEAQANREYSKLQLGHTIITAPITGTILEKVAKKGEMVTNSNFGGTRGARSSVVSMADLTDLQVELDVNEDDLPRVKMDQNCTIRVDAYPKEIIRGIVDEIAPRADRQKATVQVKVRIVAPPRFVRPEVSVRVTFLDEEPLAEPEGAEEVARWWVPREAVILGPKGPAVYIAFDGRATLRSVTTGREGSLGIEITDGLLGDEYVVVSPSVEMTDGMTIAAEPTR
jgi:HlyD family secretion protein